jgi:hypothetical protein
MSNSIQSLQTVNTQAQAEQAVQPATPKTAQVQATTKNAAPQDTVTISPQAKQALASNAQPATTGDVDHDGDSR